MKTLTFKHLNRFKKLAILFGLILICSTANGQTTNVVVVDSTSKPEGKWKFGCGFGLNFVGGTNISLSPQLIRRASDKVSFGIGLQGNYTAIKDTRRTTTIGGNLLFNYNPSQRFLTLVEFVQLNVNTTIETPEGDLKDDFWDSALFLGAGIKVTPKIALGAKWNVLYKEDESVYTSPIIPFVNIIF